MFCLRRHGAALAFVGTFLLAGCSATSPATTTAVPTVQQAAPPTSTASARVRVPILMYHHIADNSYQPSNDRQKRLIVLQQEFAGQLDYLKRAGYTAITLDDLVAALGGSATLPDKPVILTFDDGYQDFYTNAYPLLKRYGDRATIYIISGWIGRPDMMTWDELRELAASPLITIGAHTRTHPLLAKHSAERIRTELSGGKEDLEAQLHVAIHHLAYPGGSYDAKVADLARQAGFATAVTVHYSIQERADRLLELPRVFVNGGTPLDDLIKGLEGRR